MDERQPSSTRAAGDTDIWIGGGASVLQQFLDAGLLDEIRLHLVPVLLGAGSRLFEHVGPTKVKLETTSVVDSPGVTHLQLWVVR
jgi:dihydrofolate reductase